jgi:hypothetical protein
MWLYRRIKFDGVVESPIYCVAALFQEFGILHVLPHPLQHFFRNSAYYMYCLIPEKPLRLVYGTFYLAIGATFYESIKVYLLLKSDLQKAKKSFLTFIKGE